MRIVFVCELLDDGVGRLLIVGIGNRGARDVVGFRTGDKSSDSVIKGRDLRGFFGGAPDGRLGGLALAKVVSVW